MPIDFIPEAKIDFVPEKPAIDFQPELSSMDSADVPTGAKKRDALVKEMAAERRKGQMAESFGHVVGTLEATAKAITSPIEFVKQTERGVEAAATLISGSPKELTVKPSEIMQRPLVPIPEIPKQDSTAGKIAAGVGNAVIGFANFMQTPEGAAMLGIGALPEAVRRGITAAIAGQMAAHAPESFKAAVEAVGKGDIQAVAQHTTEFLGGTAMSALVAKHAPEPSLPLKLREADAPLTAAVVERTGLEAPKEPAKPADTPEGVKVGIVPPGTALLDKMIPRERGTPPPIEPDTSTPLPDFQPHEASKKIGTEPFGVGRIPVLGPILDPRTRIRDNVDESLVAYHHERGVGRAISSALGEQLRGTIDKHFDVDQKTSQIRNIGTTKEGQSTHVSDVFEALQKDPEAYVLNPEQRTAFDQLKQLDVDMRKLEDKYELFQDAEGEVLPGKPARKETYFPRIVVERPAKDVAPLRGGGMVGGKQFFQKERLFESEAEGVAKGYRYEPSIEARVVTRAERLYKAMADKRLADDPALGAKTRQSVEAELREAYSEELGSGAMTEGKLRQIADSIENKGRVWQPAFFKKIFDTETANKLNKAFPNSDSVFRRSFVNANNALKAIRLSLDLGVGQLQGLPTLYRNPTIWAKAQWNSLKALTDPKVFPEYVRENLEVVREMAQLGSSVGRLEEMMAGTSKGEVVTKIPVAGKAFEAFGRQFQTFLDTAKIELWKAWREVTPKDQWQSTMEAIESQLNTGRMETIGVSRNRALVERAMFLAPSYYRGAVNLIAAIGEKGVSGKVARQSLGAFIAGGAATYAGIALALGMKPEEIADRFNPARPDFMMWSVETETGRKFNVGFGGIFRSLLRLSGNVVKTSIEHPENWASLSPEKNPFVRWYRGHAAPVPGMVWDAFSGKDFAGYETDIGTVTSSIKPLFLQQLERKPGQPKPSAVGVGLAFLGMSAYPESLHLQFGREREDVAQKLYQKPYDKLSMSQAARVTKEVQKLPAFAVKEPSTALQRERAFKADQERVTRITEGLTKESQDKIKAAGVKVSGFEPTFTMAGTTVPLSREQQQRYEKLVIEEYDKAIGRFNTNALARLPEKRRQEIVSGRLEAARLIARRKLFTNNETD